MAISQSIFKLEVRNLNGSMSRQYTTNKVNKQSKQTDRQANKQTARHTK